jgi:hypothetical protein
MGAWLLWIAVLAVMLLNPRGDHTSSPRDESGAR